MSLPLFHVKQSVSPETTGRGALADGDDGLAAGRVMKCDVRQGNAPGVRHG